MAFQRRKLFDRNFCEFEGFVSTEPVMTKEKNYAKQLVDRIDFQIGIHSNEYSPRVTYWADLFAKGWFADLLNRTIKKGTKALFVCEYTPKTPKNAQTERDYRLFEIRKVYIIGQPDEEPKEVVLENIADAIIEASEDL